MIQQGIYVQVHRWWDSVAVYVGGKTVYLTAEQAIELGQKMQEQAQDIIRSEYSNGGIQTYCHVLPERDVTEKRER